MKILVLLAGLISVTQQVTVDLPGAVSYALEHNRNLAVNVQKVEEARAAWKGTLTPLLPQAGIKWGLNHSLDYNAAQESLLNMAAGPVIPGMDFSGLFNTPLDNTINLRFTASQLLYNPGVTDRRTMSRMGFESSQLNLQRARQDLVYQVKKVFYSVILAREITRVNADALKRAEANEKLVRERSRIGTASSYDALRAAVQTANLRPMVVQAKNFERTAMFGLRMALGVENGVVLNVRGSLDAVSVKNILSEKAAVTKAFASRPDWKGMETARKMAALGNRMARRKAMPSIMASLMWDNNSLVEGPRPGNPDDWDDMAIISLSLNIPLTDWVYRKAGIDESTAKVRQADIGRQAMAEAIRLEVSNALSEVRETQALLQTQEMGVKLAEQTYSSARTRFKNGMMTALELRDAEGAVDRARMQLARARYNYFTAMAGYEKAVGLEVSQATAMKGE